MFLVGNGQGKLEKSVTHMAKNPISDRIDTGAPPKHPSFFLKEWQGGNFF
jgi:hypothetical protein